MNGEHEVRLERIEESLRGLHDKVDQLVEGGAVNKTDIVWLKWAVRVMILGMIGAGGVAVHSSVL